MRPVRLVCDTERYRREWPASHPEPAADAQAIDPAPSRSLPDIAAGLDGSRPDPSIGSPPAGTELPPMAEAAGRAPADAFACQSKA